MVAPDDQGGWRNQLPNGARQRITDKIMETLKRNTPVSGEEGLLELERIAVIFEQHTYTTATSKDNYLFNISRKMLKVDLGLHLHRGNEPADSDSE